MFRGDLVGVISPTLTSRAPSPPSPVPLARFEEHREVGRVDAFRCSDHGQQLAVAQAGHWPGTVGIEATGPLDLSRYV